MTRVRLKPELTDRQREVLEFLREGIARGFTPTVREIGERFGGLAPQAVHDRLVALERKGFIRREPRRNRITICATAVSQ